MKLVTCDCCGKKFKDDFAEPAGLCEHRDINFIGKYGSISEDGNRVICSLCIHCIHKMMGLGYDQN